MIDLEIGLSDNLPDFLKTGIKVFSESLKAELGENISTLMLYGDLAQGIYAPHFFRSDLLLVVDSASPETLARIAPIVRQAMKEIRLNLMILTPEDLQCSCDVFPIKFLDMQQQHVLLHGQNLFSELEITDQHLRLRCEQELKNMLLRLRNFYLLRQQYPDMLLSSLEGRLSSFLLNLKVLLTLHHQDIPKNQSDLLQMAARQFGFDPTPFVDLLKVKQGLTSPTSDEIQHIYNAFLTTLEKLALIADRLEV